MSIQRLHRLDVVRLAADYSAAIRAELTDSQLAKVRAGEATAHDFTDPGDVMAEAIALQVPGFASITDFDDEMIEASRRAEAAGYHLSRVLVACEFSGIVRDAFRARGHDAVSCDVLPTEAPNGPHEQRDVREILGDGWHLMIAHPPCTYLTNAGAKHLVRGGRPINPERWQLMRDGAEFFRDLGEAPIDRIARENPIMHKHAVEIIGSRADQFVQPYHFGHDVSKRTGLHLKNLAKLVDDPADHVAPRVIEYPKGSGKMVKRWSNQSPCGADRLGPSDDRGHKRSKFFSGIARAMAEQWGGVKSAAPRLRAPVAQLELFA